MSTDETLQPDPDAMGWIGVSLFAFWLRHPEVYGYAVPATIPEHLVGEFRSFTRYGFELATLEDDLTDCIGEFRMACERYDEEPSLLRLKKFAVVYHVDNFYVRVHNLIENVYRLLGVLVDLEPGRVPVPGESSFRNQVRDRLNDRRLEPIMRVLDSFRKTELIKKAARARNLFVHQFREEQEWPMLGAEARLIEPLEQEVLKREDPLAWEVRRIEQASDLDRYAARMVDELSRTLEPIRMLRHEFIQVLGEKIDELPSTS